jgi:hypothetical protein
MILVMFLDFCDYSCYLTEVRAELFVIFANYED